MTDTKDDEAKQTAWEAGYETGYRAGLKKGEQNLWLDKPIKPTPLPSDPEKLEKRLRDDIEGYQAGYAHGCDDSRPLEVEHYGLESGIEEI